MDRFIFLMIACIIAGFALLRVSLNGTFLAGIEPITTIIGLITVILFSFVLIFNGVLVLFKR
ncbi:hypothetical protein [Halalkalibacter krulwichiae]|uniref:Uncharacterized protein n=1 Tax=Halalkalibacter krulwichiae TaxID=199441 RepID=A0A1X9MHG3_9BACI|nr:hypothetical protein [Halalkalibacter krulwichiae]ARK31950.1 hypothetical protein BkAM31D_20060 [Halalkalibacter krulwichiae]